MRKALTALIVVTTGATVLTGCGSGEKECRQDYRAERQALGLNPSEREVREACEKDRGHYYRSRHYGRGSSFRGGGSGFGK